MKARIRVVNGVQRLEPVDDRDEDVRAIGVFTKLPAEHRAVVRQVIMSLQPRRARAPRKGRV